MREMRDPGKEVARQRQCDQHQPFARNQRSHCQRYDQRGADIVQCAGARARVLAQVEGPELGEGGVTAVGHCRPGISIWAGLGAVGMSSSRLAGAA